MIVIGLVGTAGFAFTAELGRSVIERLDAASETMLVSLASACLALFLIPTAALSSVLPILTEAMIVRGNKGGLSTGVVYGVSTLGNIAGVLATAFCLIPHLATSQIQLLWAAAAAGCFASFYLLVTKTQFRRKLVHASDMRPALTPRQYAVDLEKRRP